MLKRTKRELPAVRDAVAAAAAAAVVADSGFSITRYDMLASAERFEEPLRGLHTRVLCSADIFWRFFGAGRVC